jgi:four helix bundle protein
MAAARRHEELRAWQLCMDLADVIHEITEAGPCSKNPEFLEQIRNAAEAAAPLIAEGFIRFTPDEFVRYLRMARGEIAEVQSELESAKRKKYFSTDQQHRAESVARHAMVVTSKLLKSKLPLLKKRKGTPKKRTSGR